MTSTLNEMLVCRKSKLEYEHSEFADEGSFGYFDMEVNLG